jgi:eukaryotic-like serine/threonine-protein kinase
MNGCVARGATGPRSPLHPGEILDERYRIDAPLATGGMACLYRATHARLGTRVAIKVVTDAALYAMPEAVERFAREARTLTQLRGENVVRVFDVGTTADGLPYLAMEFLAGRDLADVLGVDKVLAVDEAVDYVLQACKAVAEAHGLGIVHRDLKPANLFLTAGPDGLPCIKVIDFGLSRIDPPWGGGIRPRLTNPGVTMGSPGFMPPEQMEGASNADACSDIWSLGAVLYQLLTGEPPYRGASLENIYVAARLGPPAPPSALRPAVPRPLDEIVLRCLRADPADRYPTVAELAVALVPFGRERAAEHARAAARLLQEHETSSGDALAETVAVAHVRREPLLTEVSPARRSRLAPVLIAALVAVIGLAHLVSYSPLRSARTIARTEGSLVRPTAEPPAEVRVDAPAAPATTPAARTFRAETVPSPPRDDVESPPAPMPDAPPSDTSQPTVEAAEPAMELVEER